MAYKFHWYDERAGILQVDVEGTTSWDRYHDVIDRIIAEVQATTLDRIDVIFTSNTKMPRGNPIPHLQRTYRDLGGKEKMGLIVVVNYNRNPEMQMLKTLTEVVLKTAGVIIPYVRMIVNTHDEAVKLILQDRADADNSVLKAIHKG